MTEQPPNRPLTRSDRRPEERRIKSAEKLAELSFDPIENLVDQYHAIKAEITYQEKRRDGIIVEILGNGKPRAYNAELHLNLYDKLTNISTQLLRYGYGRVPEADTPQQAETPMLVINLGDSGTKVFGMQPTLVPLDGGDD